MSKKNYTAPCASSNECNPLQGLVCPSSTGTCNCPITSNKIFCDCQTGQYFDSSLNKCRKLSFNIHETLLVSYLHSRATQNFKYDMRQHI